MEYQSFRKPERSKGVNIKQALKITLVLVVCTWLLYQMIQIKHTKNETENYGDQTKIASRYEAISLGRKGISSWLDKRVLPDSRNVDSVGEDKESSDGRDDVSGGVKEDRDEEEFGHINKHFRTNEEELEPESQPEVSSENRYKESFKDKSGEVYIESRSELGRTEDGNEQYGKSNDREKEAQLRELPNDVPVRKNAKQYSSAKEDDEDADPRIQEMENKMQKNVVENATNAGVIEGIDEVESFHDENGVPPDSNDIETVVREVYILHEINFEG